jgi:hypothetical protein
MDPDVFEQEHLAQAALESMRMADPDRAESLLKDYFGAGSTAWTGWDEQFVTFINKHRHQGLIYGTVGDGWHFLFCQPAGEGFWVCARESLMGKGFLRQKSIDALAQLARQKGLLAR